MIRLPDLPATAGRISRRAIRATVKASRPGPACLVTAHPWHAGDNLQLLRWASRRGVVCSVRCDSEAAADLAVCAGLRAIIPIPAGNDQGSWLTPAGNLVIPCPGGSCDACQLCIDRPPRVIVGIPAP